MISTNLFEDVLVTPVANGADKLLVVSGYATSAMAFHHLTRLKNDGKSIEVDLIVGMCVQDGLSLSNHKGFQKIVADDFSGQFRCSYLYKSPPVHSKIYVWLKNGKPMECFVGSANYSQQAFGTKQREVLAQCDAGSGFRYFNDLLSETIYCDNLDVENVITVFSDAQYYQRFSRIPENERDKAEKEERIGEDVLSSVTISLLDRHGEIPKGASGLNWAFRPDKPRRNLNEAYIQLPPHVYKSDFFPIRGTHFTVLTHDGKSLICTRAAKDAQGQQIETPQNNGLLGEYFRNLLNVPYGTRITKDHLLKYGRTDVTFRKIDDETFEMDFSV